MREQGGSGGEVTCIGVVCEKVVHSEGPSILCSWGLYILWLDKCGKDKAFGCSCSVLT